MDVKVRNIRKEFKGQVALGDVSLDIRSGELIALLGPSGSGKTTLLRLIAGLEFPTRGAIFFGDRDASFHSVQERHVGFVFQQYALFKHMTVFDNIAFGLTVQKKAERPAKALIRQKVMELLDLVQLSGLEKRYPAQLSGGQRQRVALARALAIDPTVLLLDEPFGALDAKVRKDLRRWLRELHEATHHTTVFVTHDQEEALELADRVVVMSNGRIEQVGTPVDVYDQPATPFVYGFLGSTTVLPVNVQNGQIFLRGFEMPVAVADEPFAGPANLYVRAHDFEVTEERRNAIPGMVEMVRHFSGMTRLEVRVPSLPYVIGAEIPDSRYSPMRGIEAGQRILLRPRRFGLFPDEKVPAVKAETPAARLSVVS